MKSRRYGGQLGSSVIVATAVLLSTAIGATAQAPVPTTVVVRVVSNDAKLIGSGVGGARITIKDDVTGEILARGTQEGGTGDTQGILAPRERGATVFDTEGAAAFETVLRLSAPRRVEIEALGPLGTPHARQRATRTVLLVPGEHVTGDGVVLTLHGFTVELLEPEGADWRVAPGETIDLRARVTMLCGCPTEPGGLWDADRIAVRAQWLSGRRVLAEVPFTFAGTPSEYTATIQVPEQSGRFTLRLLASDPERANAGMVEVQGTVAAASDASSGSG